MFCAKSCKNIKLRIYQVIIGIVILIITTTIMDHHHHHHHHHQHHHQHHHHRPVIRLSCIPSFGCHTNIYIYTICLCLQSSSLDLCVEWSARPVWCGAPTKPTKTASTYMSSYRCFFTHCSSWNEHVPCGTVGGGSTVQTPRCQNMPNYCLWFLKLMYILLY